MPSRLTAEEERDLALSIVAAEGHIREALRACGVTVVVAKLEPPARPERTRGPAVDRLREGVRLLSAHARKDRSVRKFARRAVAADAEAEALRWQLAMSGKRIAYGEARKIGGPLETEDLVQEGFVGLYRAAKRFDPHMGLRFSTYARWWVRAQMTRAIDNTPAPIRLPAGAHEQLRNINRQMRTWDQQGIAYTMADLADELDLEPERIESLLQAHEGAVSLSETTSEDGVRRLEDCVPDPNTADPDDELVLDRESRWAAWALAQLPIRHRRILRLLYGLDRGGLERTLQEVGTIEGVSKERIRQIKEEALGLVRDLKWRRREGPALDGPMSEVDRAVLDCVWDGLRNSGDITARLHDDPNRGDRQRVRDALRRLAGRGLLVQTAGGGHTAYALPGEG